MALAGETVAASVAVEPAATERAAGMVMLVTRIAGTLTVKDWLTGVAAAYVLLPACEARTVQVPAMTKVAVVPLTVQTLVVCEAKVTVSPEVEVAARASGVPTACAPGFPRRVELSGTKGSVTLEDDRIIRWSFADVWALRQKESIARIHKLRTA